MNAAITDDRYAMRHVLMRGRNWNRAIKLRRRWKILACEKRYNSFDIESDCEDDWNERGEKNSSVQTAAIVIDGNNLYILSFMLSFPIHSRNDGGSAMIGDIKSGSGMVDRKAGDEVSGTSPELSPVAAHFQKDLI